MPVRLREIRAFRGRIRANLRNTKAVLNRLLDYNSKNPLAGLLTVPEVATLVAAQNICVAKLALRISVRT